MITSPAPGTDSSQTSTSNTSASRPSRLRGLSYLRTHLHSSYSPSQSASPPRQSGITRPQFARTESFPDAAPTSPISQSQQRLPQAIAGGTESEVVAVSTVSGQRRRSSLGDTGLGGNRIMTRSRSSTNPNGVQAADVLSVAAPSAMNPNSNDPPPPPQSSLPSIQLIPHQDPRVARPSLTFDTITRTLPGDSSIIKVGRYSEKDTPTENTPVGPSEAPVGFKSKVVSRRHCEFFYSNGQWYVKDVKSSSGTFLNHIRLSQPGVDSKPFPVNDGDIIQLGIDFKGGEEMIFRCVKIRVALNRGWQKELNTFNKSAIKRLREMAKSGEAGSKNSTECTICLSPIAPIQALFVAPCSHTWHYKCIRTILSGASYPQFICPNCRAVTDLNADVDIDFDEWDASDEEEAKKEENTTKPTHEQPGIASNPAKSDASIDHTHIIPAIAAGVSAIPPSLAGSQRVTSVGPSTGANPMNIPMPAGFTGLSHEEMDASGPMTPTNNAGPFVYD